jgi:glycosyltransferase involved in cell wall biosynthesis
MSYGRVVIASEGAGASEIIEDGVDGFVVERRNPAQIAEKIDWLKNHRAEMIEMGQRAREKARNYTWDIIRKMYVKIFSELGGC